MEKVLFELPIITVPYVAPFNKEWICTQTNGFREALVFMKAHGGYSLQVVGVKKFYADKTKECVMYEQPMPRIVFGQLCSFSHLMDELKHNPKIELPDDFSSKNAPYAYSERLAKVFKHERDDVIMDEVCLDRIIEGPIILHQDTLLTGIDFVCCDKAFYLGDGNLVQTNIFYNLKEAVIEFRSNLGDYSFIEVVDFDYCLNGRVSKKPNKRIYRSDCHMSPQEALLATANKEQIRNLIAEGQQDFVYDKKYDHIMAAPVGSTFMQLLDLLKFG